MVNNIFSIIISTIKKSFSWSGRASRKEFVIFYGLFLVYSNFLFFLDKHYERDLVLLLMANIILLFIPPLFSLIVRRLHDLNASAWWLLVTFIPFGALLFFALPFKKGSSGTNKYGEPPIY